MISEDGNLQEKLAGSNWPSSVLANKRGCIMKVRELVEELSKLDPNAEVIDAAYWTVIKLGNEIELREWNKRAAENFELHKDDPNFKIGWGSGPSQ